MTEYFKKNESEASNTLIEKLIRVIQDENVDSDLIDLNKIKILIKRNLTGRINDGYVFFYFIVLFFYSEIFKLENANTWKPVKFDKYSKKFVSVKLSSAWDKHSYEAMRHRFSIVQEVVLISFRD